VPIPVMKIAMLAQLPNPPGGHYLDTPTEQLRYAKLKYRSLGWFLRWLRPSDVGWGANMALADDLPGLAAAAAPVPAAAAAPAPAVAAGRAPNGAPTLLFDAMLDTADAPGPSNWWGPTNNSAGRSHPPPLEDPSDISPAKHQRIN
jgi:hypothetical protein